MDTLISNLSDSTYILNYFYDMENEDYEIYREFKKYLKEHPDNPNSYGYLAFMHTCGFGSTKINYKKAKMYASIGKKLNDPLSFTVLGDIYKFGWTVERNEKKFLKYYNKGAKLNCPLAISNIAKCYITGSLAVHDYKTAKKLLRKSIKLGFVDAYCSLSNIYIGERNIKKHLKCNMILLINGNRFGYYQTGMYYFLQSQKYSKAIKYFKKCKETSFNELASIYESLGKFKKASKLRLKYAS